jgi:flavin-dependent dehydrogenase
MTLETTGTTASCDVLIVGSGPAGASAARQLVRNGYSVLVVESKKLPRYKICSGLIIGRSKDLVEKRFGTLPDDVFSAPSRVRGARICLSGDTLNDLPMEKGDAYNVWRSSFDHWLIRQSGADVWDQHQFVGLTQTKDKVRANIRRRGRERIQVEASYLIGADGGASRVRRSVDPSIETEVRWVSFVQLYCDGAVDLERDYFHAFFDPSLRSFYNWLDFKDENLVYGIGTHRGDSVAPHIERFTEYLRDFFDLKIDKVRRRTGCVATDMGMTGNFSMGRGRVLLAGEAAGFMNAFGEGISSALATGQIAGEAIHRAEASSRSVLPIYTELVTSEQELTTASWEIFEALVARGFLDHKGGRSGHG